MKETIIDLVSLYANNEDWNLINKLSNELNKSAEELTETELLNLSLSQTLEQEVFKMTLKADKLEVYNYLQSKKVNYETIKEVIDYTEFRTAERIENLFFWTVEDALNTDFDVYINKEDINFKNILSQIDYLADDTGYYWRTKDPKKWLYSTLSINI